MHQISQTEGVAAPTVTRTILMRITSKIVLMKTVAGVKRMTRMTTLKRMKGTGNLTMGKTLTMKMMETGAEVCRRLNSSCEQLTYL